MRYLFAGHYEEAKKYAADHGWKKGTWRYLADPVQLQGDKDIEVTRVGSWMYRTDISEWETVFEMAEATVVSVP